MLQILRNKSQSIFIQAIVVIIALVFIFSFGGNIINSNDAAIVVNNEEISFQQYQRAYEQAYQNLASQFGGTLPKGIAEAFGLKQQVINQLVQTELLRQGGKEMGVRLSALEIQQTIQAMSQFQTNGVFDIKKYDSVLNANRLSPAKFETNMQHDMLAEKTARTIGDFSTSATEFEIIDIHNQINETVAVNYVKFSPADYADKVVINEEQLVQWFETVKNNYQTAPEVKLSYLAYNYDTVGAKIDIDDAAIAAYYQNNQEQFTSPEKRRARHILFSADKDAYPATHEAKKAQAEKIMQLAKTGEDFASLAKKYSEGPSKNDGGNLGFFEKGRMVPSFDKAVFSLQEGEISTVVKTDFGYHIIKLEEIQPEKVIPLAEAREKIVLALQEEQAQELAFQLANTAYEGIISTGSLKAYIEKNPDAPVTTTDFFSKESAPAQLKNDQPFLTAAFSLGKAELSSLIKTTNGYAIIYVDDTKPPIAQKLATVRNEVMTAYKDFLSNEAAQSAANKFLAAVKKESADFATVAQEQELTVKQTDYLSLNNKTESTFPQDLIEQLFLLSPTKPLPEKIASSGSSFYVFSYLDRKSPDSFAEENKKEQYVSSILLNKRQMILSAWLAHRQANSVVTTHKSL